VRLESLSVSTNLRQKAPLIVRQGRHHFASLHLLTIVNALKDKRVAFRSLTEGMDTTTASGELLFHVFGALAQYERALIQERVVAGLAAARRRGRVGGRPAVIVGEKLDTIIVALNGGMSKAAVCRNFGVKRTTLIETLERVGWTGSRGASSR
jgi:DNA invertase Pin-like site-specific DNA recombinase